MGILKDLAGTPEIPKPAPESPPAQNKRHSKEPVMKGAVPLETLTVQEVKDHTVTVEARCRWLRWLLNMLPLKQENRASRRSLTGERMDTDEVLAAYEQVLLCLETAGLEETVQRFVDAGHSKLGPENVVDLAEICSKV